MADKPDNNAAERTVYDDALGGSVANDKEVPLNELVSELPPGALVGPAPTE